MRKRVIDPFEKYRHAVTHAFMSFFLILLFRAIFFFVGLFMVIAFMSSKMGKFMNNLS